MGSAEREVGFASRLGDRFLSQRRRLVRGTRSGRAITTISRDASITPSHHPAKGHTVLSRHGSKPLQRGGATVPNYYPNRPAGNCLRRLELDAWVTDYVSRNGRPAKRRKIWDAQNHQGSRNEGGFGGSTRKSRDTDDWQKVGGTSDLEEAERYLGHRLNEVRQAAIYGIRPTRTFEQAVVKYLSDYQHKKSIERDVYAFKRVMPHIGDHRLDRIHNDTLAKYRRARRNDGVAAATINKELSCIRRVLNLAARVWRHENGMSWLESSPLIEMEKVRFGSPTR